MLRKILFIPMILLSACSKNSAFVYSEWNGKGEAPALDFEFSKTGVNTKIGTEEVFLGQQNISGAAVEGSFVKQILDKKGKPNYIAYSRIANHDPKLNREISDLKVKLNEFSEFLKKFNPDIKNSKWVAVPEVVVVKNTFGLQAVVKVDFESIDGFFYSLKINKNKNIIEKKRLGSLFETASALVFPEGPMRSNLMEVMLTKLIGVGILKSDKVNIVSETQDEAKESHNTFNYQPPDYRFDQVQVFYFINRYLDWLNKKFDFTLPFQVKVVTHFGFPRKTNAAFYYHGEIRLGEGDDDIYSKIQYDASIVTHETGHAFIDAIAGLPFQGEGGSINEGLADFFTCVHLQLPNLGEVSYKKGPFKRTIKNNIKLSQANGGLYFDSSIISGTLWQFKEEVGDEKALKIAYNLLYKLNPASDFIDFGKKLAEAVANTLKDQELIRGQEILKTRGW